MLTALLVLFVLMGSFAGYWSATMYKFFNGKMWKQCTLATALLFPSMIFAIFWALDIMVSNFNNWSRGSLALRKSAKSTVVARPRQNAAFRVLLARGLLFHRVPPSPGFDLLRL